MFTESILVLTDAAYTAARRVEMARHHVKRLTGEEHELAMERLRRYQRNLADFEAALAVLEQERKLRGAKGG